MNLFKSQVKKLIEKKDYNRLNKLLADNPKLANQGISIPYDFTCRTKAHPLHRICDGVFVGKISDNEAIKLAKIFLDNGADIDGDKAKDVGTPLLAAASLHAELVGIFYIENGADVHYTYKNNGESALHWASFCGQDKLVDKLIKVNASIDKPDNTYNSTPLGWAIHSLQSNDIRNKHNQADCIKLLLTSGADTKKLDKEKNDYLLSLAKDEPDLQNLLS
jgi:ankyrin repeat protein